MFKHDLFSSGDGGLIRGFAARRSFAEETGKISRGTAVPDPFAFDVRRRSTPRGQEPLPAHALECFGESPYENSVPFRLRLLTPQSIFPVIVGITRPPTATQRAPPASLARKNKSEGRPTSCPCSIRSTKSPWPRY